MAHWDVLEKSDLLSQLRIDRGADRARAPPHPSVRRPRGGGAPPGAAASGSASSAPGPRWCRPRWRARRPRARGAGSVLDASGYVTARRQATVSAKITGKVTEVLIEEGQRVREGAVLARLDDTEAQAQLGLTRAQLVAARSQLAEVQAMLVQAEQDHARQKELYDRKLIAPQALDAALAQRDMLRARLAATEEQVKVAQQSQSVAQVQLDNTVIRAPFSGVVIAKSAQPGEMISPISAGGGFTRTGIGTIVDMDSLEIQVDVNESYINRVTPGPTGGGDAQRLSGLEDPRRGDRDHPDRGPQQGHRQGPHRDQDEGRADRARHGRAGGFLDSKPAAGAPPPAPSVLVPAEAVRTEGDASVVFVYTASGKVERRSVTLGPDVSGQRRVLSGLRDGERVVLAPPPTLADGQAVKLARGQVSAVRHPRPDPRRHQGLQARPRAHRGAARHRSRHPERGLRGPDGAVGLGQDHAAQPDRRARHARPTAASRWETGASIGSPAASWPPGAPATWASSSSSTTCCPRSRPSGTWSCRCS